MFLFCKLKFEKQTILEIFPSELKSSDFSEFVLSATSVHETVNQNFCRWRQQYIWDLWLNLP